jgi:DNA-binding response OmpR family regulator
MQGGGVCSVKGGVAMRYYLSIEKNVEGFEMFKALWGARGIDGIRADSMTEGIAKAIEIEKSRTDELYFIDIVADDIDYMPQLKILSAETNAPILIATSKYSDDEHHEALNNGADFYGGYCGSPEQNINAVISVVNRLNERAIQQKPPVDFMIYGNILLSHTHRQVFVDDTAVELSKIEFDMLYFFLNHRGHALSFKQIYHHVWGDSYDESVNDSVKAAIKRLRRKIAGQDADNSFIENVWGVGYRLPVMFERKSGQTT